MPDYSHVYATPGDNTIIDAENPATSRGFYSNETLDQIRQRYPLAERIDFDAWRANAARRQQTPITWTPITAKRYAEMLDVLPPIEFTRDGFMVSEPCDHDHATGRPRYDAFRIRGAEHQEASRPMTRAEFRQEQSR